MILEWELNRRAAILRRASSRATLCATPIAVRVARVNAHLPLRTPCVGPRRMTSVTRRRPVLVHLVLVQQMLWLRMVRTFPNSAQWKSADPSIQVRAADQTTWLVPAAFVPQYLVRVAFCWRPHIHSQSFSEQCRQVGASMNLTEACPDRSDRSCQISCQDPNRLNGCIILMSLLADGSPCGFGGTCSAGKCQSGSTLDTIRSWYTSNLQIAIPVTIAAGLLLILILWGLVKCMCRPCIRGKGRPVQTVPVPMSSIGGTGHRRLHSQDMFGMNDGPYRSVPPTAR